MAPINDLNLKISLITITNALHSRAKRAVTTNDKAVVYDFTETLAAAIGSQHPGFSNEEFMKACGVSPDWAEKAA